MSREKPKLAITRATAPRLSGTASGGRTTVSCRASEHGRRSLAFRCQTRSVYSRSMRRWVAAPASLAAVTLTACGVGGAPVARVHRRTAGAHQLRPSCWSSRRPPPARSCSASWPASSRARGGPGRAGAGALPHQSGRGAGRGAGLRGPRGPAPGAGRGRAAAAHLRRPDGERWPEDRRESLQGLSEREAAELVARTLLRALGASAPSGVGAGGARLGRPVRGGLRGRHPAHQPGVPLPGSGPGPASLPGALQ